MKPMRTWIAVADGAHARFLSYAGLKSGAGPIPGQVFNRHAPPSRDIVSDKPGRTYDSKGHGRHAIQPRTDAHDVLEQQFLRDVVRQLDVAFEAGSFDDLVMIAPPRALGMIREMIPERMKSSVILEIDKDLTRHSDQEVSKIVTDSFNAAAGRSSKLAI